MEQCIQAREIFSSTVIKTGLKHTSKKLPSLAVWLDSLMARISQKIAGKNFNEERQFAAPMIGEISYENFTLAGDKCR